MTIVSPLKFTWTCAICGATQASARSARCITNPDPDGDDAMLCADCDMPVNERAVLARFRKRYFKVIEMDGGDFEVAWHHVVARDLPHVCQLIGQLSIEDADGLVIEEIDEVIARAAHCAHDAQHPQRTKLAHWPLGTVLSSEH